jgi:predicted MFS family arabinose efflux permease
MILYPIVCIPEAYIVDNISSYLGLSLSSFTTLLGSFLKAFPNKIFLAYIGQILCSVFQPVILNSPAKISAVWFKDENRAKITTICVISNNLGVMFGIIFHTFFIDDNSEGEEYKSQFEKYVLAEFILTTIFCLPTFFLVKSKPKIPVSPSQNQYKAPPLKASLKLLFKNKNFNILLVCFTCIIGVWNMYGTIFTPYMAKYNISDSRAAIISSIANFASIFFAMIGSYILDKTKKFRLILLICNLSALLIMVTFTLLLEFLNNLDIIFGFSIFLYSSLVGFLITIHTNGMDYVCELTYPVGESQSGGIIMSMNQISGIGLTYLGQWCIDSIKDKKYITNIITCSALLISLITLWFIEDKLLRHEKENEGQLISEE